MNMKTRLDIRKILLGKIFFAMHVGIEIVSDRKRAKFSFSALTHSSPKHKTYAKSAKNYEGKIYF